MEVITTWQQTTNKHDGLKINEPTSTNQMDRDVVRGKFFSEFFICLWICSQSQPEQTFMSLNLMFLPLGQEKKGRTNIHVTSIRASSSYNYSSSAAHDTTTVSNTTTWHLLLYLMFLQLQLLQQYKTTMHHLPTIIATHL